MRFTVTAIIECELLSRFDCRLLAWCVCVSWGSAAYVEKGADWVGGKRVTRDAEDGVTARAAGRARSQVCVCVVLEKVTWQDRAGRQV